MAAITGKVSTGYSSRLNSASNQNNMGNRGVGIKPPTPSLALDFTSGVLDPRITFSRLASGHGGTYFDSNGVLQTAKIDFPTGSNIVVNNPNFSSDTWWTKQAGWTISNTVAVATAVSSTAIYQALLTVGNWYQVTYTVVSVSEGGFKAYVGSNLGTLRSNVGTYTEVLQATVNTSVGVIGANATGTIDNIDVRLCCAAPRFESGGLLIEESRANVCTYSNDMSQWGTKTDFTFDNTQAGIQGVANTATLCQQGSAGTAVLANVCSAVAAGSTITASFYIKPAVSSPASWVTINVGEQTTTDYSTYYFNISTGVKSSVHPNGSVAGAASASTCSISQVGNGWYKCICTVLPNGSYTVPRIRIFSVTGDNSSVRSNNTNFVLCAVQIEAGSFPTSYIPTTTTALTRAADSASMTGTNFSSWWNATEGTFVSQFDSFSSSAANLVFRVGDGTATGAVGPYKGNTTNIIVDKAATGTLITHSSAYISGGKHALGYNASGVASSYAGSTVLTNAATVLAGCNTITLGKEHATSVFFLNGHISHLTYYPKRLTDATLKALTL